MCWGPTEGKDAVAAPKVIEGCVLLPPSPSEMCAAQAADAGAHTPRDSLVHLLRASPSPQMQYQLAFCFWLLTFEDRIAAEINACVADRFPFVGSPSVVRRLQD